MSIALLRDYPRFTNSTFGRGTILQLTKLHEHLVNLVRLDIAEADTEKKTTAWLELASLRSDLDPAPDYLTASTRNLMGIWRDALNELNQDYDIADVKLIDAHLWDLLAAIELETTGAYANGGRLP